MDASKFSFVDKATALEAEPVRPSLNYWQDAWRRLKKHKPSIVGLGGVIFILLFGFVGPFFFDVDYADQRIDFANLPPVVAIYEVDEDYFVFLTQDYKLIRFSRSGVVLDRLERLSRDNVNKIDVYSDGTREVILDFSYNLLPDKMDSPFDYSFIYQANYRSE